MKNTVRKDGRDTHIQCRHRDGSITESAIDSQDLRLADAAITGRWHIQKSRAGVRYCVSSIHAGTGKPRKKLYLHGVLMGNQPGKVVDHRDGNGLNNRRSGATGNLQFVTPQANAAKCRLSDVSKSKLGLPRNVSLDRRNGRYAVVVSRQYLGKFDTLDAATIEATNARAVINFQRLGNGALRDRGIEKRPIFPHDKYRLNEGLLHTTHERDQCKDHSDH